MIGIYGGTFDPIHFGHLNLAIEMLEKKQLDEVWFCPAFISPHKLNQQPTAAKHRWKMLEIALSNLPQCRPIDIELQRSGPSYTIDTLRVLIEQQKGAINPKKFTLIISDENAKNFYTWHHPEEIVELVPLLIGRRSISPLDLHSLSGGPKICDAIRNGMVDTRIMDMSSREIRQRLKEKLCCYHLVPKEILDYIYQNQLYLPT